MPLDPKKRAITPPGSGKARAESHRRRRVPLEGARAINEERLIADLWI